MFHLKNYLFEGERAREHTLPYAASLPTVFKCWSRLRLKMGAARLVQVSEAGG